MPLYLKITKGAPDEYRITSYIIHYTSIFLSDQHHTWKSLLFCFFSHWTDYPRCTPAYQTVS